MVAITPLHVYVKELEILLNDEIERLTINLSMGHCENHAEYKYLSGKIQGLRTSLDFLEEADKIYKEKYM